MTDLEHILDPTGDKFTQTAGPAPERVRFSPLPSAAPAAPQPTEPTPKPSLPDAQPIPKAGASGLDAALKANEAPAGTSLLETAQAAVPSASLLFQMAKRMERDLPPPEPGYEVPKDALRGTQDEIRELVTATSPEHLRYIQADQATRREFDQAAASRGMAFALVAGAAASLPDEALAAKLLPGAHTAATVYRIGARAARAEAMGARVLAASARNAQRIAEAAVADARAARAMEVAEDATKAANSLRGVAVDTAVGAMGTSSAMLVSDYHHTGLQDWALDVAVAGALGSGIHLGAAVGPRVGPTAAAVRRLVRRGDAARAETQTRADAKYAENPEATPEQVQTELLREDTETVRQHADSVEAAPPERMVDPEDMGPEPPEATEPPAPKEPPSRPDRAAQDEPGPEEAGPAYEMTEADFKGLDFGGGPDRLSESDLDTLGVRASAGPEASLEKLESDGSWGYNEKQLAAIQGRGYGLVLDGTMKPMDATGTHPFFRPVKVRNGGLEAEIVGLKGEGLQTAVIRVTSLNGRSVAPVLKDWPLSNMADHSILPDAANPAAERLRFLQAYGQNARVGVEHGQRVASEANFAKVTGMTDAEFLGAFEGTADISLKEIEAARAAGQRVLVHGTEDVPPDAIQFALAIARDYLPDGQTVLLRNGDNMHMRVTSKGDGAVSVDFSDEGWRHALVHELGHHVTSEGLRNPKVAKALKGDLAKWHADLIKKFTDSKGIEGAIDAMASRGLLSHDLFVRKVAQALRNDSPETALWNTFDFLEYTSRVTGKRLEGLTPEQAADVKEWARNYIPNFSESLAEQFTKHVAHAYAAGDATLLPKSIMAHIAKTTAAAMGVFKRAMDSGLLAPDARFEDFMQAILALRRKEAQALQAYAVAASRGAAPREDSASLQANILEAAAAARLPANAMTPAQVRSIHGVKLQEFQSKDPLSQEVGLDSLPTGDPNERGTYKALRTIWYNAIQWGKRNPYNPNAHGALIGKVEPALSAQAILDKSNNDVARYVSGILLESPTGSQGRRTNAGITSALNYKKILGNTVRDFEDAQLAWAREQGGGLWEALTKGKLREQFNLAVIREIEGRGGNSAPAASPHVKRAADAVEAALQRSADLQRAAGTIGNKLLPASSKGYFPHHLSPRKLMAMTPAQQRVLADTFADQFITYSGWDPEFSMQLAYRVLNHARQKAVGGLEIDANVYAVTNAGIVEDALKALGLSKQEVEQHITKYQRGAMSHVRQRIKLDLGAPMPRADGSPGTLLDAYETDVLALVRNQSRRVAGEAALARNGIYGKAGLDLLRHAMTVGDKAATASELKAFDQVAAEFLGQRYGTAGTSLAASRITQATSLLKLGGAVWNQLVESTNLAATVGVAKTLESVTGFKRLHDEIKLIARGQDPTGSLVRNLEKAAGVDYGLDGYRVSAFLDNHGLEYELYGAESPGMVDRLLRGGLQAQAKYTGWRAVQAVQQRGAAEAITRHLLERVRGAEARVGDADLGIDDNLLTRLRQYPQAIKIDASGRIVDFDPSAMPPLLVQDLTVIVQRGVSQVIQELHVGERNSWHHSELARILTQFRTYPISAIEKQWGRQRNIRGTAGAMGLLLGAMSVAAPVYMARTALAALGRDDAEQYLAERLSPWNIAKASLSYLAVSGMSGDFLELLSDSADPDGRNSTVVGSLIGPSAGVLTDALRAGQATLRSRSLDDAREALHDATKLLPGARAPFLVPLINALEP